MRSASVFRASVVALVTIFGTEVRANSLASEVATLLAPADNLCLLKKTANIGTGLLTSKDIESSLQILACYPENSSQRRAYGFLSQVIYSKSYGSTISSLRGRNAGLIDYFDRRLKSDEAFFQRARSFYEELQRLDQDFFLKHHPELIGKIPNLAEVSGQGKYAELPPG